MIGSSGWLCPACYSGRGQPLGRPLLPLVYDLPAGKVESDKLFPFERWLHGCSSCGLRFYPRLPGTANLSPFYASNTVRDRWGGTSRSNLLASSVMQYLRAMHPNDQPNVLDIGCHTGDFLAALPPSCRKFGVEINPLAARIAAQALPAASITTGDIVEMNLEENRYDLITAWDVVEHIPRLGSMLQKIANSLTPDGVFVFETGDFASDFARVAGMAWYYYAVPDHTTFLSRRTVGEILGRNGLAQHATKVGRHSHLVERSWGHVLAARAKTLAIILYTMRGTWQWPHRVLSKVTRRDGALVNPYFADHMTVVAQKATAATESPIAGLDA